MIDGAAVRLVARSSDYRTPPWGVTDQPAFLNAVIVIATTLAPRDLLARAQDCEEALGRDRARERRWGPRPIDIDLLTYDDLLTDHDLTLPHPRMLERAFVLVPLAEIAPGSRLSPASGSVMRSRASMRAASRKLPPRARQDSGIFNGVIGMALARIADAGGPGRPLIIGISRRAMAF